MAAAAARALLLLLLPGAVTGQDVCTCCGPVKQAVATACANVDNALGAAGGLDCTVQGVN